MHLPIVTGDNEAKVPSVKNKMHETRAASQYPIHFPS